MRMVKDPIPAGKHPSSNFTCTQRIIHNQSCKKQVCLLRCRMFFAGRREGRLIGGLILRRTGGMMWFIVVAEVSAVVPKEENCPRSLKIAATSWRPCSNPTVVARAFALVPASSRHGRHRFASGLFRRFKPADTPDLWVRFPPVGSGVR